MSRRSGVRLRLRSRLAAAISTLVVVAIGSAGWVTLLRVEESFSAQFDARVDQLLDASRMRYEASGTRAVRRVDELARGVLEDRGLVEPLLLRPDPSDPRVVEAAARMARVAGLDLLEIVAPDGTILSSAQWLERAGFADPEALGLPAGRATLRHERLPGGEVLAVVARRDVELGERRATLVGGAVLGAAFLDEIAPTGGEALLLIDAAGGEPARAGEAGRLEDLPAVLGDRLHGRDGSVWAAGTLPLTDPTGQLLGTLVVAVDRAELEGLLQRLRGTFAAAGATGALLAVVVGFWAARRITRPLAGLVRAVDAVAAGEADYSFPQPGGDEVGMLIGSFSRMQRSLRDQQDRLRAAERVAAWREVARRVAHEVKNPLSPIRLTVENLQRARSQAPDMFDAIFDEGARGILEEVDQLERIVTEFSEFARLPSPSPAPVDLEDLVDSVLALYAREPGLTVRRERGEPLPILSLDADQISRALKNLVGNAVEAMRPEGGTLRVRTGREGVSAFVELTDTGPGFSPDVQARLFEPYFTTREKGTGLGMPIALRILADHGGSIVAANTPGGGARVTVRLPLPEPGGTNRSTRSAAAAAEGEG